MVFQYDVGNIHNRILLASAEVEYEHHLTHVDTWHVALPEDVVLACLQVDSVGEVEHTVVAVEHEFHGRTVQVLVAVEDGREVVVAGSRGREVGVELHLCLPLVSRCLWQLNRVVVACIHESWIINLCPSWSIPELHAWCNALPHVVVAVCIEACKFLLAFLAGEDEAPCDAVVFLFIHKHHLAGSQLLHAEEWILVLFIRTHVRE